MVQVNTLCPGEESWENCAQSITISADLWVNHSSELMGWDLYEVAISSLDSEITFLT